MTSIKTWWVSSRPFSFSASLIPVLFGAMMAINQGGVKLNPWNLTLSIVAMMLLHAGANNLNDIIDFQAGLDKTPTPVSGGVVRGIITIEEAWRGVWVMFGIGSLIGIYLSLTTTWALMGIGIPGLLIGWFYSKGGQNSLKYNRLGDLAVFLNFGTLGALGSWMVQTHSFSWLPVIWSIPISLLVIGIVHANNWRDIPSDRHGQVHTVANRLGDQGSMVYYTALIFSPYLYVLIMMSIPKLWNGERWPMTGLLVLLSLPLALSLYRRAQRRHTSSNPMEFIILDGGTAQLNLLFGLLCTLSILLDHVF